MNEQVLERSKPTFPTELIHECPDCGYVYKVSEGCEREGYPAGTAWEDIPDDFPCPDCFVREKPDFIAKELVQEGG